MSGDAVRDIVVFLLPYVVLSMLVTGVGMFLLMKYVWKVDKP